jgi:hypothetical protein
MHKIDRRKLMVGGAVGAVALAVSSVPACVQAEDKLLDVIRRYKAEAASWKTKRDISDEELDADIDRAEAILNEVEGLTAIGAAGAVAALDLLKTDYMVSLNGMEGEHVTPLINSVRRYIIASS